MEEEEKRRREEREERGGETPDLTGLVAAPAGLETSTEMSAWTPEADASLSPLLPVSFSPFLDALHRLRRNPVALACVAYMALLIVAAVFAPLLAHWDYAAQDYSHYAQLPAPPDARHLLGTDDLGRDVLSRLLYGARVSLGVALLVVILEVLIGVPLGLITGYYSGRLDTLLMRVTDVVFAFPDILLAILLAAVIRGANQVVSMPLSLAALFIALGAVGWPGIARLVRGQTLALREKEYIEAARALGASNATIIWKHVFPNVLSPLIVQVTQDMAGVILAEATLAFLGLGVAPPFPSWGRMINEAREQMQGHPTLLLYPSLLLALTVMAFNFFGDALRDALDPRLRQ